MYTKITSIANLKWALIYHERKVKQGVAECIYAGNMIKDVEDLTIKEKQYHIERLTSLNSRIEKKLLHVILSFHDKDHLEQNELNQLIRDYMKGMGWEKQPWLAWLHRDTIHRHVHIVSSRIRSDGQRIDPSREIKLKSYALSRNLEDSYGLYQVGRRIPDREWLEQHPLQPIQLGVTPLRPAMNAILDHVIPNYNYTSIDELNAVLGLYRAKAVLVRWDNTTGHHQGLVYAPLDEKGEAQSTNIKARALRQKPTINVLEARFKANRSLREAPGIRVTTAIDWAMAGKAPDLEGFKAFLEKQRIHVVLQHEKDNGPRIYYIDRTAQAVFDGNGLGERYSAASILQRCSPEKTQQQQVKEDLTERPRLRHRLPGTL